MKWKIRDLDDDHMIFMIGLPPIRRGVCTAIRLDDLRKSPQNRAVCGRPATYRFCGMFSLGLEFGDYYYCCTEHELVAFCNGGFNDFFPLLHEAEAQE